MANKQITHADLAVGLSSIARLVVSAQQELAFGMWNPDYCSAECPEWAASICIDLQNKIEHITRRIIPPVADSAVTKAE